MKPKSVGNYVAALWTLVRPLQPQHRSREAWTEYCRKRGKKPDGTKL